MIDIIVPVFRGLSQTKRCLDSVLACTADNAQMPFELVVIDDHTPEPAIAAYLDALSETGLITLLRNPSNLGFVRSVNLGMSLHADRDVVLLNSDTEVANDWLQRLGAVVASDTRIATVTPFSNNASICSYPFEGWTGGVAGGLGLAAMDRLFAMTHGGQLVEIPTAVGFCMYIRREALDGVGLFDAERFGRGYGEENDFCLRVSNAGWRNVLAADVYVFHEGSVSFSSEREALSEAAMRILLTLHPDYLQRVHEFLVRDPIRPLRLAIDNARIALAPSQAACVAEERASEKPRILPSREAVQPSPIFPAARFRLAMRILAPVSGRHLRARLVEVIREEGWAGLSRRIRRPKTERA